MPEPAPYRLRFDGRTIHARHGQSVAAALVEAGVLGWRTTRGSGRPRGVFCGIGVCFDCLITVDGRPDQRACLVPAADGMRLGEAPPQEVQERQGVHETQEGDDAADA